VEIHDGCGLSAVAGPGRLLVSSGAGELFLVARDWAQPSPLGANGEFRFDNHMTRI
jgi:hypothetical protein